MKRILCTSMVQIMLLTACSVPVQQVPPNTELSGDHMYGIYELDFSVERISGWPFEEWDFVYTYNGGKIQSGHKSMYGFAEIHIPSEKRNRPVPLTGRHRVFLKRERKKMKN